MKKLVQIWNKIIELWKAETPKLARLFQSVGILIAGIPVYYSALPDEFKNSIPTTWLKYIAIAGGICAIGCQLFKTKSDESK